ncbi:MAG: diacylglycerol kinase family lipid kinase [Verrucomicrobia bacterium]|nr:diacylglycerol kinase family lipid kinase [Verrucomicrobiota bacterium]
MRACIIFNPTAKGDKARHFRRHLAEFAGAVALKPTQAPGDGRRLAAEAVRDGFDTLVAAGGDGTVNEVLNGMADAPEGFTRARLAVLPLGTVNVFARELGLPLHLRSAWQAILNGTERMIDVPFADYTNAAGSHRRFFAQMAGAGLDARAISLVDWETKKRFSQFAYVLAGMKAMRGPHPPITVEADGRTVTGELVLVGNGRFYGGRLPVFPDAKLDDGLLDLCVFPRVEWGLIARYALGFVTGHPLVPRDVKMLRAPRARLTAASVPFEVEGDLCGMLPVELSVLPGVLRVVAPR